MNLINDPWIPVRRKNGAVERIAAWQLTESIEENVITELAAPRPDFNGALIQFLIGLLQTTCAPENPKKWRQWLQKPPAPKELKAAFEPVAFAFDLDGNGPRFMQDLTLGKEIQQLSAKNQLERKKGIYELLIDVPTGKTLEDNTDHFIKRGGINQLCQACCATALFTLQTNAPMGGRGFRTGLRGGGPMTTLVLSDYLWGTCWFNVLERNQFYSLANQAKNAQGDHFPWCTRTRTSEADEVTTPKDVHPDQIFWSMPRRISLSFSTEDRNITCDLCGMDSREIIRDFRTKNYGVNYSEEWKHPLSPYFFAEDGTHSPIHPQRGGIGYRHWLGLVQSSQGAKGKKQPALVIGNFIGKGEGDLRLWAFGFDMDNMKTRCWYDSTMPLILGDSAIRESYEYYIAALVDSSKQVSKTLRIEIRKALFKANTDVKGDLSFVESRFWQETEGKFYESLHKLRDALTIGHEVLPVMEGWHKCMAKTAIAIFNDISQSGVFEAADPKRIALSWQGLQKAIYGKNIRTQLGLPMKK
jgi:CRISPR system Cascade subunit CasA